MAATVSEFLLSSGEGREAIKSTLHAPIGRFAWITLSLGQSLTLYDAVPDVELEDTRCDLTNRGQRLDEMVLQSKMLQPLIQAWVEEARQDPSRREGADVAAFVQVGEGACQSQAAGLGSSTMLLADDVVYMTAKEGVVLVDETVLAHPFSSFDVTCSPKRSHSKVESWA